VTSRANAATGTSLAGDLAPRGAPLEYWFFRIDDRELAFLVDFIVRRRTGQAEVRVSLWIRGRGQVVRMFTTSFAAMDGRVVAGDCELTSNSSRGSIGDVRWDLRYAVTGARAAPRVPLVRRLHPFDLELISRPRATFQGRVSIGAEAFEVPGADGCITHYWGRRLPDSWHWVSALSFTAPDGRHVPNVALEASFLRSRLWGRRPDMAAGYLWMQEGGRQRLVVSPLNGLITASGRLGELRLTARYLGGSVRLLCSAPVDAYNDLGEAIQQTLLGTCRLDDRGLSCDRAGLEHRIL
jgi:hypothetical protein